MNSIKQLLERILGPNTTTKSLGLCILISAILLAFPKLVGWLPSNIQQQIMDAATYIVQFGIGIVLLFVKQHNVSGNGAGDKPFEKPAGGDSSRLVPLIAAAMIPVIFFSACASDPAQRAIQKAKWSATGKVVGNRAWQLAKNVVMQAAVSQIDQTNKSDFLHSASQGLRENMLSVVNSDDIASIIKIWTPDKNHWTQLAASAAELYAETNPQTDAQRQLVIEAIASGLQKAAQ